MSAVYVTTDGDTHWLECYADDPDAEHGTIICPVGPGDGWDTLSARVAEHHAEHGCAEAVVPDA